MRNVCFFSEDGKLNRCDEYRKKYPKAKKPSGRFCQYCGQPLKPPRLPQLGDVGWFYDTEDLNRRVMGLLVGFYDDDSEEIEWMDGYNPREIVETDAEHPWVSQYGHEAFSRFEVE